MNAEVDFIKAVEDVRHVMVGCGISADPIYVLEIVTTQLESNRHSGDAASIMEMRSSAMSTIFWPILSNAYDKAVAALSRRGYYRSKE